MLVLFRKNDKYNNKHEVNALVMICFGLGESGEWGICGNKRSLD